MKLFQTAPGKEDSVYPGVIYEE